MIYLDAGTTYSKIITNQELFAKEFLIKSEENRFFYILPSSIIKSQKIVPDRSCGHMANASENEIIALAQGAKKITKIVEAQEATVLDLGSRDAKWIKFKDGKFHDMDWNTSCASSTGATVEMLLKFYGVNAKELSFDEEKFAVTCGIFGMESGLSGICGAQDLIRTLWNRRIFHKAWKTFTTVSCRRYRQ